MLTEIICRKCYGKIIIDMIIKTNHLQIMYQSITSEIIPPSPGKPLGI